MQDFIAALMAVLGTLLVLAGAAVTVLKAPASAPVNPGDTEPVPSRFRRVVGGLNGADRLIAWGVVLLVLAAVAAGAISFNFGAQAGSR
jgi:hypothetical protein